MKKLLFLSFIICAFTNIFAQTDAQKIYDAEKAFEKAAAEKGVNQSFIEFTTTDGTCLFPGYPVNCREFFKKRAASPAALYWNPTLIDVSSNGALAYSTGNSVYKPKGRDDANSYYGEYATIWQRQPDSKYLAVFDIGISHEQPNNETKWTSPADSGKELNEKKFSAADSSTAFFETAVKDGLSKAYKTYLAEDARLLREGKMPVNGKKNALEALKNDRTKIFFAKRSVFIGAADMAYISNSYTLTDRNGKQAEKGTFLQVWKLRGGRWQIVFDIFAPAPPDEK